MAVTTTGCNEQHVVDIHWFDPQPHLLRLEDRDGRVEPVHDSQRASALFAPYRAVGLRASGRRDARPGGQPAGMNQLGRANVSWLMRIDVVLIGMVLGVGDG
jgi:hypothetical protein